MCVVCVCVYVLVRTRWDAGRGLVESQWCAEMGCRTAEDVDGCARIESGVRCGWMLKGEIGWIDEVRGSDCDSGSSNHETVC